MEEYYEELQKTDIQEYINFVKSGVLATQEGFNIEESFYNKESRYYQEKITREQRNQIKKIKRYLEEIEEDDY